MFRTFQKLDKCKQDKLTFLFVTILSGSISILGCTELNYVNAQNMSNSSTMGINITNSTDDGKGINGNSTAIDTETSLPSEDAGGIASLPNKCLGSALCPD
ncbi:MAG: hypothetical protein QN784_10610 [Nitrososphaeraceae archaeon]|nr:hypothetical protein [Nitrososphaeraceae archaeon]MDW0169368.1 hypothetical protein [Nitrososphaeraceae archaeon]MDW0172174.1 hypothetical protein [Nitrososphaeraceae archaeon]MDW0175139.1 hypothetical protein [Nitrososphaeraceae archaeon]MDW0178460.1 hypothetical protein [Nitrososphaeraceae archaeon]